MKNGRHSKPESCPWHQVGNDAFVGFPPIYLPELLFIVDFDTDAVL